MHLLKIRSTFVSAALVALACSSGIAQETIAADPAPPAFASLPTASQPAPAKARSPQRTVWLTMRCAQLVAFFDRYGVSRGENSDGPRNHTRIAAAIDCERGELEKGKRTMEALLKRKAFDAPVPDVPEVEPQDIESPDITSPTRQGY